MLHPRDAVRYGPVINEVVTDLIKRICYLRQASPCGTLVTDVSNNLYLFSLEGR
jgi:cholestanetriol 26-monooxygenase